MNKTIKTMVIAGLACVALCGTTVAAPAKNGGKPPAPAKQHQQIKAPAKAAPKQQAKIPAKPRQQVKAPAKAAPKHQEVKRHADRPHEEPRREVVHKPAPVHHVAPVKAPPPKPAPEVCVTPPPAPAPVVCVATPPPPPPAQTVIVEERHDADPIVALGCALIGGIIGAIAG